MKNRLTTLDIAYLIEDIRRKLGGLRVDQIYDIDKKTYLIRFSKPGGKITLLLESGTRFHTTSFEWPKNPAPSGFAMKLRKHLNNKRLEKITQLGADRIVDLQFGSDTFAHHVILELYDKGNILLTDHTYKILNLLRPRIAGQERLAAHETYATTQAKQQFAISLSEIEVILKDPLSLNKALRELFMSKVEFGPALFNHCLKANGLTPQTKVTPDNIPSLSSSIDKAFQQGCSILQDSSNLQGFILCTSPPQAEETAQFYDQFHPSVLISDYPADKVITFESFDCCVDEFFSKIESQKLDLKQLNQEKEAIKKLERVKLDQQKRLEELKQGQEVDRTKAELITNNQGLVEMALNAIRKLVASQIPWTTIEEQLKEARKEGDPLAGMIAELNLKQNSINLLLRDPYEEDGGEPVKVAVDLNLSAYANATRYYDAKKQSAKKEERTLESQEKAFKSTEKRTLASIKEAQNIHLIKKQRKVLWFEKFRWFVTSENYLVLGGRDQQQNELLVKKYLRKSDIYMHADAHGAPSVVVINDNPEEAIPPKSINEAASFAVCCSGAWDSKVVSSCWWVGADQVSKSAPTGEYLPTGSFMIRGKKNYVVVQQLVLGFGFLFRVTEDSAKERHAGERARRGRADSESTLGGGDVGVEEELEVEEGGDEVEGDEEMFPDTKVEIGVKGKGEEEEFMIMEVPQTGGLKSVQKMKNKQKKEKEREKKEGKGKAKGEQRSRRESEVEEEAKGTPKRGQHGRKKKLKEKYKDQDEEEREMKLQLLKTGKIKRDEGKDGRGGDEETQEEEKEGEGAVGGGSEIGEEEVTEENENEGGKRGKGGEVTGSKVQEEEEEEVTATAEQQTDLLRTLTGLPFEEDEILYAIPVVAPYSTLQNYKFRIKMTPGTNKRGKAAKTALESFLRDKEATQREKDLIKAVKDGDLARNFPGKIKLSNVIRDKK